MIFKDCTVLIDDKSKTEIKISDDVRARPSLSSTKKWRMQAPFLLLIWDIHEGCLNGDLK